MDSLSFLWNTPPHHIYRSIKANFVDKYPGTTKLLSGTVDIVKAIFNDIKPYIVSVAPWWLSRTTSIAPKPLMIGSMLGAVLWANSHPSLKLGTLQKRLKMIQAASIGLACIDRLSMGIPFTLNMAYRLGVDNLLLLSTAIGGVCATIKGIRHFSTALKDGNLNNLSKIQNLLSGIFLTTLGVITLTQSYYNAELLFKGARLIERLDPLQQQEVLRHRALHTLAKEKSCSAVVLSNWVVPFSTNEVVYDHCETLKYPVASDKEFCESLADAVVRFDRKIDVISLAGHSSTDGVELTKDYLFQDSSTTVRCLNESLAENAQVLLLGCNTATTFNATPSLAERLAQAIPNREVTGFPSYMNFDWESTSFDGRRFSISHFYPLSLNGITLSSSAITFKASPP